MSLLVFVCPISDLIFFAHDVTDSYTDTYANMLSSSKLDPVLARKLGIDVPAKPSPHAGRKSPHTVTAHGASHHGGHGSGRSSPHTAPSASRLAAPSASTHSASQAKQQQQALAAAAALAANTHRQSGRRGSAHSAHSAGGGMATDHGSGNVGKVASMFQEGRVPQQAGGRTDVVQSKLRQLDGEIQKFKLAQEKLENEKLNHQQGVK